MSEKGQLETIAVGTAVIGVDGVQIGTVEAADPGGIRMVGHDIPSAAIERVAADGVHLHLAKAAFEAHQDRSR
ncbi:MAG TPA: hypothetical protein VIL85_21405 [Thermomicrobiales bacterium]|jgi:hypothetical protein